MHCYLVKFVFNSKDALPMCPLMLRGYLKLIRQYVFKLFFHTDYSLVNYECISHFDLQHIVLDLSGENLKRYIGAPP